MISSPDPAFLEVDLGAAAREAGIVAGFTTRAAGNLALDVGDDPARVHARREVVAALTGRGVDFAHHVHGTRVLDPQSLDVTPREDAAREPDGDAWCAQAPAGLGVLAADCLPVLLADPGAGVIGAAHAGRVGLLSGVLTATIDRMRRRGAREILAVIGPAICGRCYEVSPELAADVAAAGIPVGVSRWGTPALDLPAIAERELRGLGADVRTLGWCTLEDPRFFSHRSAARGGGRHAGVITRAAQSSAPAKER